MSYELMSDERLQDELLRIQSVLNERIEKRAATEAEREQERSRLEKQARARSLAPILSEYRKLVALCENEIEMRTSFEIPIEMKLTLTVEPDSDPDDEYYDDLDLTVKIRKGGRIPDTQVEALADQLADIIRDDFDYDEIFAICGGGKIMEINQMKKNINEQLERTDYSWDDLTDLVEER